MAAKSIFNRLKLKGRWRGKGALSAPSAPPREHPFLLRGFAASREIKLRSETSLLCGRRDWTPAFAGVVHRNEAKG